MVVRVSPVPAGRAEGGLRGRGGEVRLEGRHGPGEVCGRRHGRHAAPAREEQPRLAAVQEEGARGPLGDLHGRTTVSMIFTFVLLHGDASGCSQGFVDVKIEVSF